MVKKIRFLAFLSFFVSICPVFSHPDDVEVGSSVSMGSVEPKRAVLDVKKALPSRPGTPSSVGGRSSVSFSDSDSEGEDVFLDAEVLTKSQEKKTAQIPGGALKNGEIYLPDWKRTQRPVLVKPVAAKVVLPVSPVVSKPVTLGIQPAQAPRMVLRSSQRTLRPRRQRGAAQAVVAMDIDSIDMDIDVAAPEDAVAMDVDAQEPVAMDIDVQHRMATRSTKRVTRSHVKAPAATSPVVAAEPKKAAVRPRVRVRSHSATPALKEATYAQQVFVERKAAAQAALDAAEKSQQAFAKKLADAREKAEVADRTFTGAVARAKTLTAASVRSPKEDEIAKLEERAMLKRMEFVQALRDGKTDEVTFKLNDEANELKELVAIAKASGHVGVAARVQERRVAHQAEQKDREDHKKSLKAVHDELKQLFELQREILEGDEMALEDARSRAYRARMKGIERAKQLVADLKKRKSVDPLVGKVDELASACTAQREALKARYPNAFAAIERARARAASGAVVTPPSSTLEEKIAKKRREDLAKKRIARREEMIAESRELLGKRRSSYRPVRRQFAATPAPVY
jgi:hypothetical protein